MKYHVRFSAYCGMTTISEQVEDRAAARRLAARILRRRRRTGHPVAVLERGREWEAEEPEDCMMVPDSAGVLTITEVEEQDDEEEDDDADLER